MIAQVVGIDVGWVNLALEKAGEVRGDVSYSPPPRSGVVDSGRAATP